MKKMLLALAVSLLLLPSSSYAKPMDVRVVLDLLDAGVSETAIQRYVQRNHFTFDLAAEDLKALKKAGASDTLVEFLQGDGSPEGEQTGPAYGQGDDENYDETYDSGPYADYGDGYYSPGYAYGYYYSYPYYYPSYYAYPYYYPYAYYHSYFPPTFGGRGSRGSGVVSYWYRNHGGGGTSRPPSRSPGVTRGGSRAPSSGSRPSGGRGGGSSHGRGRH